MTTCRRFSSPLHPVFLATCLLAAALAGCSGGGGGGGAAPAAPPTIALVAPATGLTLGGSVVITGTGFSVSPPPTVTFDTSAATVTGATATALTLTAPAHAAGAVTITVTNPDGQSATRAAAFTYVTPPAPVLSALSAGVGGTAGGTTLTLTGTHFLPPVTVSFGAATASPINESATSLQVVTPAGAAGAVDVVVHNADGQSSNALPFTYVTGTPPPVVSSIAPASGPTAGGITAVITGANFSLAPPPTVTIGNAAAAVLASTETTVTLTSPAGSAGAADVVVTNGDGQSATLAAGFTFVPRPSVASVNPTSGTTAGGDQVVVSGSGFSTAVAPTVLVGATAATVTAHSATSLTVTTPPNAAGVEPVTVRNPDGQVSTEAVSFTYVAPTGGTAPTVVSVQNAANGQPRGAIAGGETVNVSGTGFAAGATVSFGAAAATNVQVVSPTLLTALTPVNQPQGTVDVTVTVAGLSGTLHQGFTFLGPAPSVVAFNVLGAPAAGGGLLLIKGSHLRADTGVTFGGTAAAFSSFNAANGTTFLFDELTVVIPPSPLGPAVDGFVDVVVTNPDGQSFTLPPKVAPTLVAWPGNFHYGNAPNPTSFSPGSGKGLDVTLSGTDFSADTTGARVGLQVLFSGPSAATLVIVSKSPTAIVVTIPQNRINACPRDANNVPIPCYCFTVNNFDFQSATRCGYVVP